MSEFTESFLPLTLSPEQKEILNQTGKVISISYKDSKMAAHTIAMSALSEFVKGKNSILVIQDKELRSLTGKILREYLSPKWCKEVVVYSPFEESEIIHIRSLVKDFANQIAVSKLQNFTSQKSFQQFALQKYSASEKIWEAMTYSDVYYRFGNGMNDPVVLTMLYHLKGTDLSFTIDELQELLNEFKTAKQLYPTEGWSIVENIDVNLSELNISDVDEIKKQIEWCQDLKNVFTEIKLGYFRYLTDAEQRYFMFHLHQIHAIENGLDELQYLLKTDSSDFELVKETSKNINRIFLSGKSKIPAKESVLLKHKELIISKILSLDTDIILSENLDTLETEEFIKACQSYLVSVTSVVGKKVSNSIKSLNTRNLKDEDVLFLEKRLHQKLESVNASKFFIKKYEVNTLSIIKQAEIAEYMERVMFTAIKFLLNQMHLADWNKFYNKSSDLFKKVFVHICHINKSDWAKSVEYWYMNALLKSQSNPPNYPELYFENVHELSNECVHSAIKTAENGRNRIINLSQEIWADMYKDLWDDIYKKKNLKNWNWKFLLEKYTEFVANYYPILILDSDKMDSIGEKGYDNIFYLKCNEQNPEILQAFSTIHSYYDQNTLKDTQTDYSLKLPLIGISKAIRELALSEKLSVARDISCLLISVNPEIKIFQTRDLNILSCLSESATKVLKIKFNNQNLKEILPEYHIHEHIIESLLETDRTQILLIENYLLQSKNKNMLWQFEVIKKVEECGIAVISFDLDEALRFDGDYIQYKLATLSEIIPFDAKFTKYSFINN